MFDKIIECIRPRQALISENLANDRVNQIDDNFNQHVFRDRNGILPKRYTNVTPCGEGAFGYVLWIFCI